ncbi:MAG: response regulator, partial [Aurantimonas coralicida]
EVAIREGMRVLLVGWGCEVEAYGSASEAIPDLGRRGIVPDIALVDYHLDEGTGLDAVTALRRVFGPDLPVILVTADRSPGLREQAAGMEVDILTKPLKPASLRAAMGRKHGRREAAE